MPGRIKQFAINNGKYISSVTPMKKLIHFFKLIKPLKTDIELIRLGGDSDGGYLIPNDLNGIKTCFSPGVSLEALFENDLLNLGIKSYLADYSIDSKHFNNKKFDFLNKYIGFENQPNYITLSNWIQCKDHIDSEMILQMDIEGGEYNVITDTSIEIFSRFRIIIIEFHKFDMLLNTNAFDFISASFYKLLTNFHIVHIHPNNCSQTVKYKDFEIPPIIEFTFLRKDRIKSFTYETNYPHSLDKKNLKDREDLILPKCFYL